MNCWWCIMVNSNECSHRSQLQGRDSWRNSIQCWLWKNLELWSNLLLSAAGRKIIWSLSDSLHVVALRRRVSCVKCHLALTKVGHLRTSTGGDHVYLLDTRGYNRTRSERLRIASDLSSRVIIGKQWTIKNPFLYGKYYETDSRSRSDFTKIQWADRWPVDHSMLREL